jgi:hypothetical protein
VANIGSGVKIVKMLRQLALLLIALSWPYYGAAQEDCSSDANCQSLEQGLTEAEILAYGGSRVEPLVPDGDLLFDRNYQRVEGNVEIFDAPNGSIINVLDNGYNFVTVINQQDGWAEINPGQWIRSDSFNGAAPVSHFAGVLLPEETPAYPFAWTLVNLYPSQAPGDVPYMNYPIVWRYTRVNLYASVEVDGWLWYQIGPDQWVHQTHVAKFTPIERPATVDTDLWVSVDLYEQVAVAYEGDIPVFATLIAAGLEQWATPEGLYHIYFRRPRHTMNGGRTGYDFYYLEEVPWTMFFDEGRALHGAYWHDEFGYRHSHGCINMSITDAYWLYGWVAESMGSRASADVENGPAVYIYSTGEYR